MGSDQAAVNAKTRDAFRRAGVHCEYAKKFSLNMKGVGHPPPTADVRRQCTDAALSSQWRQRPPVDLHACTLTHPNPTVEEGIDCLKKTISAKDCAAWLYFQLS